MNPKLTSAYNKLVRDVGQNINDLKTNVAVAEIMSFVNLLKEQEEIPKEIWIGFLRILAPFSPHITEELWYRIHNFDHSDITQSIHLSSWPTFDPNLCQDQVITIAVQINGKIRSQFETQKDNSEELILELAKNSAKRWLENKKLKFCKVVPNKLVSLVIED